MKKLVVILDNGHGKNTKGKCSPDKRLMEWAWCREIVQALYKKLKVAGIDAEILVPEDTDISLSTRVSREKAISRDAKKAGKETCLISVHVNAAGGDGKWKSARGWSGWVAQESSKNSKTLVTAVFLDQCCSFLNNRKQNIFHIANIEVDVCTGTILVAELDNRFSTLFKICF